jgi:hypothetical protein
LFEALVDFFVAVIVDFFVVVLVGFVCDLCFFALAADILLVAATAATRFFVVVILPMKVLFMNLSFDDCCGKTAFCGIIRSIVDGGLPITLDLFLTAILVAFATFLTLSYFS